MSRRTFLLLLVALLPGIALAESSAARLAKAHAELNGGSPATALELLRELQVEQPNDERVRYALGCAQYKLAEAQANTEAAPGPAPAVPSASFDEAQKTFDGLIHADDRTIARAAAFNRANCLAQSAKALLANPAKASDAQNGLRSAIVAYEDLVRRYPDDASAQQNLDHVRYLLKKLQAEKKDEEKKDDQQQKDEQQKAMLNVRNAATEIPGARAVVGEDSTVKLVQPGSTGGTP